MVLLINALKRRSARKRRESFSSEKLPSSSERTSSVSSSFSSNDELSLCTATSLDAQMNNNRNECKLHRGRKILHRKDTRVSDKSLSFDKKERLTYFSLALCLAAPFTLIHNYRYFWWVYVFAIVCEILYTISKKHLRKPSYKSREVELTEMFDNAVMKLSSNEVNIVQVALELLAKIIHQQPRRSFPNSSSRINCTVAILVVMEDHIKAEPTQELACSTLCHLLSVSTHSCKNAIAQNGGIDTIMSIMRHYANNKNIQRFACTILWSIASGSVENKYFIANAGGIFCIISAMKRHPGSLLIQEQACGALANLSVIPENQSIIAQYEGTHLDGIVAILSAMEKFTSSFVLQKRACGALSNLALNTKNRIAISERDGVNAVLTAMKQHPTSSRVQEMACNALANLTLNNVTNEGKIGKQGGICAISAAMKNHPGIESLQKHACTGLADLSSNAGNKVRILRANGIQLIVDTMSRYHKSSFIQEKSCIVLGNLAAIDADNITGKSGGISSIISAMRHHPSSVRVQSKGCWALQELSQLIGSLVALRNETPKNLLENASERFPAECSEAARSVILKL